MSIADRLFGHKSLTADWVADSSVPLQVDLSSCRFCGMAPGNPIERLRHLGPADTKQVRGDENVLVYRERGLQLFLNENQCLEMVDINLMAESDMAAFVGSWSFQGQLVAIDADSTSAYIQSVLGSPDRTHHNEAILYTRAGNGIWFEWGDADRLENVVLSTLDMLPG